MRAAILLVLAMLPGPGSAAAAERTVSGHVVRLVTAEIVEVRDHTSARQVRLAGVAVPGPDERRGGTAAFLRLRHMLRPGTAVTIVAAGRQAQGGWPLAALRIAGDHCRGASCPHTLDVGLALLTVGLGRWRPALAGGLSAEARGQYAFAETEARARRAGMWGMWRGSARRGRSE